MTFYKIIISVVGIVFLNTNPAHAASNFLIDFEKNWDYVTDIADYYNGGSAYYNGSTTGFDGKPIGSNATNYGVSFTNTSNATMFGLSNNDGLGTLPNGDYYANAPSLLGIGFQFNFQDTPVYMNVVAGVDSALSFYYSNPVVSIGAIKAYSGLNGTGTLLGSYDMLANSPNVYNTWTQVTFNFTGTAQSFDFGGSNRAGLDNISASNVVAVPEPEAYAMLLAGLGFLGFIAHRKVK